MATRTYNERSQIMYMTVEYMKFIDSIWLLPVPLRKLYSAFGLSA
jgi:hypothetical protein